MNLHARPKLIATELVQPSVTGPGLDNKIRRKLTVLSCVISYHNVYSKVETFNSIINFDKACRELELAIKWYTRNRSIVQLVEGET